MEIFVPDKVKSIDVAGTQALALTDDGAVYAWGTLRNGRPIGLQGAIQIATGGSIDLGLRPGGTIATVGFPKPPGSLSNVVAIAANRETGAALTLLPGLVNFPLDAMGIIGQPFFLQATATGAEPLFFQWRLDGSRMEFRCLVSSKFVIVENTDPSGHLYEIPHVGKAAECVIAFLQEEGKGATWMFEDAFARNKHWQKFVYASGSIERSVDDAVVWAENFVKQFGAFQQRVLPRMKPAKLP